MVELVAENGAEAEIALPLGKLTEPCKMVFKFTVDDSVQSFHF